jgi:hypothetical protein
MDKENMEYTHSGSSFNLNCVIARKWIENEKIIKKSKPE